MKIEANGHLVTPSTGKIQFSEATCAREPGLDAISAKAGGGGAAPPVLMKRLLRLHPLVALLHSLLLTDWIVPMDSVTMCSFIWLFRGAPPT